MKKMISPYKECPTFETEHFLIRLVEEKDSVDLLACYSDRKSAKFFNSDNCTSDFIYDKEEDVEKLIKFWIEEYNKGYYVRFSLIEKEINFVIGTIEAFSKKQIFKDVGEVGVLRIDLKSEYETIDTISELLDMISNNFFKLFDIDSIITKAIPKAQNRIVALKNNGYRILQYEEITSYDDYYIKT
jgi:RimJ/RimL family protein N-acetyltransferase